MASRNNLSHKSYPLDIAPTGFLICSPGPLCRLPVNRWEMGNNHHNRSKMVTQKQCGSRKSWKDLDCSRQKARIGIPPGTIWMVIWNSNHSPYFPGFGWEWVGKVKLIIMFAKLHSIMLWAVRRAKQALDFANYVEVEDCGQRFTGKCKLFCLGWQLLFSDRPALWVDELVAQCQLCPAGPAAGCSLIDLYLIFIRSFCFGCGLATICLSASQVKENLMKNGSFIAKLLNWQFIARKQCEKLLATPRPHAHIPLLNERTVYLARKRTQTSVMAICSRSPVSAARARNAPETTLAVLHAATGE